jgi:hypothetical protein
MRNTSLRTGICAALLCALLGACATKPPEPVKFTVDGFSISLNPKDGWTVLQNAKERIVLAKPGDFTGETLTIVLAAVRLAGQTEDALQRHARDSERQGLDPKRFRVLRQDISPHAAAGLACVQSRLEVEDRGAAGATGPVTSLVTETLTITCPNPSRPNLGVSASYAHQSYPEDKGRLFLDKGMPILNTLEYAGKD